MYSSATTDPCHHGRHLGGFAGAGVGVGEIACSEPSRHDVAALAVAPRWPPERTLALPGRCRGSVMARWADSCRRHFGDAAVLRLRSGLPAWAHDLPDDPPEEAWFPVGLQLRLTELVIDELLGGDALRLEALLRADIRRALPRATAMFLRAVGPAAVLGRAKQIHPHLYDVGTATAELGRGHAVVACEGAMMFGHPTWLLLQLFAHRGFIALTGRDVAEAIAIATREDAARIELAWT